MSPEVISRKITRMLTYMEDLIPYRELSYDAFLADHYKVERLVELLVMAASDIAFHLLANANEPPPVSYRSAFLRLGELEIIDAETSSSLALGAGLRNILVHDYEDIDYKLLHNSIPTIIRDIHRFMDAVVKERNPKK
jgi:uncharacterized protein YutE (UPF0331/DUF86 family)